MRAAYAARREFSVRLKLGPSGPQSSVILLTDRSPFLRLIDITIITIIYYRRNSAPSHLHLSLIAQILLQVFHLMHFWRRLR